jgi:hypothetical protein
MQYMYTLKYGVELPWHDEARRSRGNKQDVHTSESKDVNCSGRGQRRTSSLPPHVYVKGIANPTI